MKIINGHVNFASPISTALRGYCLLLLLLGWLAIGRTQTTPPAQSYNTANSISNIAQLTTLAFSGLGIIKGNLDSQSFFPPGKVADYFGFQYLRDNDPSNMGHDTDFLTRVANNVIYMLNDTQFKQLQTLAVAQNEQINLYGYKRYPLMQAFRRLIDGDIPTGSTGLDLETVKQASHDLYLIDGQLSYDRAVLYAGIINSLDSTQVAYLNAMKDVGFNSWPNITNAQIDSKMKTLPQGSAVAVMGYAGDIFSWYVGNVDSDVYFCPERHGTYYGSFYMKDAPAVNVPGYNISETITATAGSALSDSNQGYVTAAQAALMSGLLDTQRNNLYAGATSIVSLRTQISTLLRSLLTANVAGSALNDQVLELSGVYGDLDGEDNYYYATAFAQLHQSLTDAQQSKLTDLWNSILTGTYTGGASFDFTVCKTPFLYSGAITDQSVLAPYIANTDYLFLTGSSNVALSSIALSTSAASPQPVNSTITLNSVATGGTTVQYQFWIYTQNATPAWSQLQGYSTTVTCNWAPGASGSYLLSASAKDGVSGVEVNTTLWYTITTASTLSSVTLFANPPSPHPSKPPITLTALAIGGTNVLYQFWAYNPNVTPAWSQLQSYSTSATCVWLPSRPGSYLLSATAQDGASGVTVNATLWYTISGPPLSAVTVTTNPASPQAVNTKITFSAAATGGTDVQYQFWLYNPNATPAWSQLQGSSTSATCTWTPTASGSYFLSVTAQDGVSGAAVNTTLWYTITGSPLTAIALTTYPASPQNAGTPITLSATATGGTSVQYQFWVYNPNVTPAWSQLQGYSTLATCTWTPALAGNYLLSATARDGVTGAEVNTLYWYTIQ